MYGMTSRDVWEIGKTQGRERKDSERMSGFNQYYRKKQITRGRFNTKHCIVESALECVSDGDSPKLATRPFLLKRSSGLGS